MFCLFACFVIYKNVKIGHIENWYLSYPTGDSEFFEIETAKNHTCCLCLGVPSA